MSCRADMSFLRQIESAVVAFEAVCPGYTYYAAPAPGVDRHPERGEELP